jgi:ankyrin repeat protein
MKAAKIVAFTASIVLLSILPAKARQQVKLKFDEIPVKVNEHYGFGTRFVEIMLERQYYSKENLERLWQYYCQKYPDKKDKLDVRVYAERGKWESDSTTAPGIDANFNRQGEEAAAYGGDNEFYWYRPNLDEPKERANVQLKGRYPFLRDSYSGEPGFDFVLAAGKGELARLEAFLEAGGDVNVLNDKGRTALMAASRGGHFEIVRSLLSKGANPNLVDNDSDTALKAATMAAPLVDITPAPGSSAESIEIVKLLLASGADVNAPKSWPALVCAAESGNDEVIKLLLENGADINAKNVSGMSALSRSIYDRKFKTARLLIASGADVDSRDNRGDTPLMFAAQTDFDVLRNLLDKGADVNARNKNGETPLIIAFRVECIVALLDHGAELDAKNLSGNTALMCAASSRNSGKVEILLDRGADVNERNTKGETALAIAKQINNQTIIEMLVKFGGKE